MGSNYTDASGEHGIFLTRFDQQFNIVWEKTIDEPGINDRMQSMVQDSFGNLIIVGQSDTNALLIKTDSVANILWSFFAVHRICLL